jgi:hypothetical protein
VAKHEQKRHCWVPWAVAPPLLDGPGCQCDALAQHTAADSISREQLHPPAVTLQGKHKAGVPCRVVAVVSHETHSSGPPASASAAARCLPHCSECNMMRRHSPPCGRHTRAPRLPPALLLVPWRQLPPPPAAAPAAARSLLQASSPPQWYPQQAGPGLPRPTACMEEHQACGGGIRQPDSQPGRRAGRRAGGQAGRQMHEHMFLIVPRQLGCQPLSCAGDRLTLKHRVDPGPHQGYRQCASPPPRGIRHLPKQQSGICPRCYNRLGQTPEAVNHSALQDIRISGVS